MEFQLPKPTRWNHTGNSRDAEFRDLIFHVDNLLVIHFNENPFSQVIYTVINFGPEPFDWKILKNNSDTCFLSRYGEFWNKVKQYTIISWFYNSWIRINETENIFRIHSVEEQYIKYNSFVHVRSFRIAASFVDHSTKGAAEHIFVV